MKLALKVALAAIAGIVVVLTVFAVFRIQREVELFDSDMRKDHLLVGTTLAVAVADAWINDGPDRAGTLVQLADADRIGTQLGWLPAGAAETTESLVTVRWQDLSEPAHQLAHLSQVGGSLTRSLDGDPFLVSLVPVRHASRLLGALEIATSFAKRDAYVAASTTSALLAAAATALVAAGVTLGLGLWLIGKPMKRLVEKARRVGASDLSGTLDLKQKDEIGQLAQEMNAMCDQLRNAQERATDEAQGRIRALQQLRHAERLITVGKLAAGVAHELGTPLNIVSGRARMIVRGKVQGAAVAEYCRSIADQADRMVRIISQLLDFSRRKEPLLSKVDLSVCVKSCVAMLAHAADKHNVAILAVAEEPVSVRADAGQLEQVVTNLVMNAVQACESGGTVRLRFGLAPADAPTDGATTDFGFVEVSDTGSGISPEVAPHVFEPFYTTKDVGQGSGLGLSVVHGIVSEHGGRIDFETAVGSGSRFIVYLPAWA